MLDLMQIGEVCLSFDLPYSYHWTLKDLKFKVSKWNRDKRLVRIKLIDERALEEPNEKPCYQAKNLTVWEKGLTEIRSYRATFAIGHPFYAVSRMRGNEVEIFFNNDVGIWNHPNMMLWSLVHLENQLLLTNGLIFHCCYTLHQNDAILFTAPSGTGKTTQATIWKRVYGSEIINGDLCVLQQVGGRWMACGYPLSGSAPECENRNYYIKTIAIIRQSVDNIIEQPTMAQKVGLLYSECFVNTWNAERVNRASELLTDLVTKVPVVMLHCNIEDEAASTLYKYIYEYKF